LDREKINKYTKKNIEKILNIINKEIEHGKLLFDQIYANHKNLFFHKISINLSTMISLNSLKERYLSIKSYFDKANNM
jgi:hypothetical protein